MHILDKMPWIRTHIALYKSDPAKAHYFQSPGVDSPKPTLLLTTTGCKSGEKRDVALIYGKCPTGFAVVGSLGGSPKHPSWYVNLQAHPEAEIQVGVDHYHVRARLTEGAERATLLAELTKILPNYADYEKKTQGIREMPVVVLEVQ